MIVHPNKVFLNMLPPTQSGHLPIKYGVIGRVTLNYLFFEKILCGVRASKTKNNDIILHNFPYSEAKAWLEDKHIDCFTYLLEKLSYRRPNHSDKSVPVILDPHFYEILLPNPPLALDRLRMKLNSFDLLSDQGWEAHTLLLPMAKYNQHWILIYIDCVAHTFWVFDPFTPDQPSEENLNIADLICGFLQNKFGLQQFNIQIPDFCHILPVQKDGYNCGIFVLIYLYIIILKHHLSFHDYYGPQIFRLLLCVCIFCNEIKQELISKVFQ